MPNVRLVVITPRIEPVIAYIARVSNPKNQRNPNYARLLRRCIRKGHWSVFEHGHLTIEIVTSLAVAAQILRHRSFTFQQLSRRYNGDPPEFEPVELRRGGSSNRQGSLDELISDHDEWSNEVAAFLEQAKELYLSLLDAGVARECARMVLPQATRTKLYMTGNVRSWLHYVQLRVHPDAQKEHREIAEMIKAILIQELPVIAEAAGWIQRDPAWLAWLKRLLRKVARRLRPVAPRMADFILRHVSEQEPPPAPPLVITEQDVEMAAKLLEGEEVTP